MDFVNKYFPIKTIQYCLWEKDKYAKIVIYNETGMPIKDDFRLVNLEKPKKLNVTSSSIAFDVPLIPDEFTNTINVHIKRLIDSDDGIKRTFPMSPSGITNVKGKDVLRTLSIYNHNLHFRLKQIPNLSDQNLVDIK